MSVPPPGPDSASGRLVDRLIASFERRHQTFANRAILVIATPLMVWGGLAILRALPVPAAISGVPLLNWALAGGAALVGGAFVLSLRLGWAMLAFVALLLVLVAIFGSDAVLPIWQSGITFLVLGWIAWLVGRRIEGRPRDLGEIAFDLLMAPVWLIATILRLLRIGY